jgi:hypothetical protein
MKVLSGVHPHGSYEGEIIFVVGGVVHLGLAALEPVASATASTRATRSLTPKVFTETPKRSSASTLSPSVTATSRLLSPNRARRRPSRCSRPAAVRIQPSMRRTSVRSVACPATVLRATPIREKAETETVEPVADDVAGFDVYMERHRGGLVIERAAVEALA